MSPSDRKRAIRRRRTFTVAVIVLLLAAVALALSFGAGRPLRSVAALVSPTKAATAGSRPVDPSVFAPGSCVSYPPERGNRHLTVFLDAGHGGIDPGAIGTTESGQTIAEADETLPIELDAMRVLRKAGFRVVVSRTTASTVLRLGPADTSGGVLTDTGSHDDVAARDVCANMARADVLVGIYLDAGGTPGNAGCVTGYDADRPFAADNLKLATLVQRDVLAAMNAKGWAIPDEGVLPDGDLGSALTSQAVAYGHLLLLGPAEAGYFSTPSQMPGALIEPLFITDPFEGSIAAGSTGQHVIAGGLAEAVEQYLAPPPPTTTTTAGG